MPSPDRDTLSSRVKPGPRKADGTILLTFVVTFLVFSGWLAGIFIAPYLRSLSSPWARLIYAVYSPFCHQVPERSFNCFGHPLSVCARCLGIYAGLLFGLVLYPFVRGWRQVRVPGSKVFFALSAPIVLDTAANFIRLWQSPNAVRLATGLLWGTVLPLYLVTGLVDLLRRRRIKRLSRDKNTA